MGKYALTNQPPLPASCIGCGIQWKGSHESMVDTTVSLDYVGALLLCTNCTREMAELIGMVDVDKLNETRALLSTMELLYREEKQKVTAHEQLLLAYNLSGPSTSSESVIVSESESDSDEETDEEDAGKARAVSSKGKSKTDRDQPGLFE